MIILFYITIVLSFGCICYHFYKKGYSEGITKGIDKGFEIIDKVLDDYFKEEENEKL